MVDKIATVLGISASALFEETASPENIKRNFEDQFGKTLESELIARIEKAVKDVCRLI